jgi:hypothetical protein
MVVNFIFCNYNADIILLVFLFGVQLYLFSANLKDGFFLTIAIII